MIRLCLRSAAVLFAAVLCLDFLYLERDVTPRLASGTPGRDFDALVRLTNVAYGRMAHTLSVNLQFEVIARKRALEIKRVTLSPMGGDTMLHFSGSELQQREVSRAYLEKVQLSAIPDSEGDIFSAAGGTRNGILLPAEVVRSETWYPFDAYRWNPLFSGCINSSEDQACYSDLANLHIADLEIQLGDADFILGRDGAGGVVLKRRPFVRIISVGFLVTDFPQVSARISAPTDDVVSHLRPALRNPIPPSGS